MIDWSGYRSLLLFGGSFDPPHRAHVQQPMFVRTALDADAVVYVPAGRAPHKMDRAQTATAHRVAMLRLALADEPRAVVWCDEVERVERDGRPSYTVDTLERLHQLLPAGVNVRLLIGTDQVRIFQSWYRWERVVELAEPIVMLRPPERMEDIPPQWRGRVVEVPVSDTSSTEVRRRVRTGESIDDLVSPAVSDYIAEHGLYRK